VEAIGAVEVGTTGARDATGAAGAAEMLLLVGVTVGTGGDGASDGCGLTVGSAQASLIVRSVFPQTIWSCSSVIFVSGIVDIVDDVIFKSMRISYQVARTRTLGPVGTRQKRSPKESRNKGYSSCVITPSPLASLDNKSA
jgi:hypothetical protein